jgi:hypothetical protein
MTNRISVHDVPTTTPARDAEFPDENQLTAEEHVASARALEAANQPAAAIQSWHRASVAFSKRGEHDQVSHCIRHAEQLAGNRDFSASLERKNAAADGTDGEVFGDHDEAQPTAAVSAPVPTEEVFGDDDPTEDASEEG